MALTIISTSNKQALSHAEAEPLDATVCEYTLRKVRADTGALLRVSVLATALPCKAMHHQ